MFKKIVEFFTGKPAEAPVAEVPYKVETPVESTHYRVETPAPVAPIPAEPAKCGCGRSPSGNCVGLHKLTPEEWAVNDANPTKAVPAKPKAPARKPAVAKPKETAPATPKAPAKPRTPRKPRAPK
jgi:hypothetical protein